MFSKTKTGGLFLFYLFSFALILGSATLLSADDSPFAITIDKDVVTSVGETVYVEVLKTAGTGSMHGFDLLLHFDTSFMSLLAVEPSYVFDLDTGSFEWEYFQYRDDTLGLVRAVGIANMSGDEHTPVDVYLPDNTPLFTLTFQISSDSAVACNHTPIQFYWQDCGDNAIAYDSLGTSLVVSDHVYNWNGYDYVDISDYGTTFPTYLGTEEYCIGLDTSTFRFIDFYNGDIEIECGEDPQVTPSDINCDGITYAVADYVLYYQYFFDSLAAFGTNVECAINNSDVNFDGQTLQFEDLIYFNRYFAGTAPPYSEVFPHNQIPVVFTRDTIAQTVSLNYPDELVGMSLVFQGNVTPTFYFNTDSLYVHTQFTDGYTRILLAPETSHAGVPFIAYDEFMSYTGDGKLVNAAVADFNDNVFPVSIVTGAIPDEPVSFGFKIGTISEPQSGDLFSIPVTKESGSEEMGGFDFVIGYDNTFMSVTNVVAGPVFNDPGDYQWAYFTWRNVDDECTNPECPSGIFRVVGLADDFIGDGPLSLYIENSTDLFYITGQTYEGYQNQPNPVSFYWYMCSDNGVSSIGGDTAFVSYHVYDYNGIDITDTLASLPSAYGFPDSCDAPGGNPIPRFINFHNGGIIPSVFTEYKLVVSLDTVVAQTGDTGIYLDVFLNNPQDSIAAFELTLSLSNPELVEFGFSETETITFDNTATLTSDWDLMSGHLPGGMGHMVNIIGFSNQLPPYDKAIAPQEGGRLVRVLLHAYDTVPDSGDNPSVAVLIDENPINTAFSDPAGNLLGVLNQQYDTTAVSFNYGMVTIITFQPGDSNGDDNVDIGDAVYTMVYIFKGGPPPDPLCKGNVNQDSDTNLGDVVYMVNYIFNGGASPCLGCE